MNTEAVKAIYKNEMRRTRNTLLQSVAAPVISTALYFVVFGSAIGSRIESVNDVAYGAFIVPGLMMLSLLTQSISNASFGIFFPKFTGTIYEVMAAPISFFEILLGYVGAAATKSLILGVLILITATFFVDLRIAHPFWMIGFFLLTCVTFSLFLIITPLVFLGGSFYSVDMLPEFWQKISLFNPVLYLISGFRWSFFEVSDVSVGFSLSMILLFLFICIAIVWVMFKTGYKLKP